MTLETLLYNIGELALKNNLVNAYFAGGSLYELNAEIISEYPLIFLTPAGDHIARENVTRFNVTIYYVDRLWDDDRNETDICSAAIETLKNIKRQLPYLDWVANVEEDPVIRLFTETERMSDRVAGAYMTIYLDVLNASTCPEFLDELGRPMGNYIPGNLNVLDSYATKAWVILQKYADKPWVLEQIENIKLSGGTTEKQVLEMIASALTEYTKTNDFATINNSAITEGGDFQLVERSEFNDYSAMTTEELERIIELIDNIPMSSVTENITVLSSVTSSHTEDISTLSADTSALTENLAVLSAYTHDSVSSLTHSIETLSAGTETAISGLSDSISELSASTETAISGFTEELAALAASQKLALFNLLTEYGTGQTEMTRLYEDMSEAYENGKTVAVISAFWPTDTQFITIAAKNAGNNNFYARGIGDKFDNGSLKVGRATFWLGPNDFGNVEAHNGHYYFQPIGTLSGYTLPTASSTTLGGVKVGSGLTITNQVLSTQYQIWEGSKSAYEALASHDPKTFYVITDLT